MNYSILSLEPLLVFVQSVPLVPKRGTKHFRTYRKLCSDLLQRVPDTAGLYIWVGPSSERIYRYVGISVEGFRNRFGNYFQQEYTVHWETVHGENPTIALACEHYPKWVHTITSQSYRGKAGTKFIVYYQTTSYDESQLLELEAELIQHFDPVANVDRPKPQGFLHSEAMEIANGFSQAIQIQIQKMGIPVPHRLTGRSS